MIIRNKRSSGLSFKISTCATIRHRINSNKISGGAIGVGISLVALIASTEYIHFIMKTLTLLLF